MPATTEELAHIPPDDIGKNPDNPRLIFRQAELTQLEDSIREVGIQVPLTVYPEKGKYVLLDGERRLRCALKLNLKEVPAIIVPKPSKLENILRMFNIHNVRRDWDLMPMALKLDEVRDMLAAQGKDSDPMTLATVTGLSLSTVNRAIDLISLPDKYKNLLLSEAEKPYAEQVVRPDLFFEIYKSLHVIERHAPEALSKIPATRYVEAMVTKYRAGVIDNVVSFREISRMARSELAGVKKEDVIPVIRKLVEDPKYSITSAYSDTVETAYQARDLITRIDGLVERLGSLHGRKKLPSGVIKSLKKLRLEIDSLVE
jgi:ParB family transcriptional regulator, chromosome partitioning protein